MSFPAACPHGPIQEVMADVFVVRGSVWLNRWLRITRNMAIVRHEGELTLIDPIRLDSRGEDRLESLGRVRRLLRLGALHGQDDRYYAQRYGTELWAQPGGSKYTDPKPSHALSEATTLPFPAAELFFFQGTNEPECALLLQRENGLLLTCDAIQHYGDYEHNNLPARIVLPFVGFPKTTLVGPLWLKMMTPEGDSLEGEFRRLLELSFDRLFCGHGSLLASGAHAAVARAVDKAFPKGS